MFPHQSAKSKCFLCQRAGLHAAGFVRGQGWAGMKSSLQLKNRRVLSSFKDPEATPGVQPPLPSPPCGSVC